MKQIYTGKTALVTGASSGLGAEFARQLSAQGANLILVARRKDKMDTLAAELVKEHGIQTHVYAQDLSLPDAAQILYDKIHSDRLTVDILINNAGFAVFGYFDELSWEKQDAMLDVDIKALTQLTRLFLEDMKKNKYGRILMIASNAAFQPTPHYATYAASKAYVLYLGEALHYELRRKKLPIHVSVLCPGVTETEFLTVSGQKKTLYQKIFMMQAPKVVRIGLKGLHRNRPSRIAGFMNWLLAASIRFVPRALVPVVADRLMKND